MLHKIKQNDSERSLESPTAWFCVLESARRRGDPELVKRAECELRRLGVRVKWVAAENVYEGGRGE